MTHLERACELLKQRYNDRVPIFHQLACLVDPGDGDAIALAELQQRLAALPIERDDGALTMTQLIRLFRAVKGEFQEVL